MRLTKKQVKEMMDYYDNQYKIDLKIIENMKDYMGKCLKCGLFLCVCR